MMIELESTGIKVNLVSLAFTRTNGNGHAGTESVEDGSPALCGPQAVGQTRREYERTASGMKIAATVAHPSSAHPTWAVRAPLFMRSRSAETT
jgi:NAD(P)-dependent dehydrogenase (short-subunit alcohol dehydrogenase family)